MIYTVCERKQINSDGHIEAEVVAKTGYEAIRMVIDMMAEDWGIEKLEENFYIADFSIIPIKPEILHCGVVDSVISK